MSITTYASQACNLYPLPEKVKGEPKRADYQDDLSFEVAKLQYLKCEAAWERQKASQREKRVQHVEECLKQKKELNEEVKLQPAKRRRGRPPKQVPNVPIATAPKRKSLPRGRFNY